MLSKEKIVKELGGRSIDNSSLVKHVNSKSLKLFYDIDRLENF